MKTPEIVVRYHPDIDAELRAVINGRDSLLYDMMRYHLGWIDERGNAVQQNGGKTLRPALCLFSCEAVGGDYRKALPAAAAVELVHNFSLIHDDIQDNDTERRHRQTVWSIWGKPQAINAGTAMRILANVALKRFNNASAQKVLAISHKLDEISLQLIEGQHLDISYEDRFDIRTDDYLNMIKGKTASLMSGAMELGAMVGTDNEDIINSFKNIGMTLGMAFQIKDDILGIWGDKQQTGKPSVNDIRRKKKTFPVVWSLENINGSSRRELLNYYRDIKVNEDAVLKMLDILDKANVKTHSQHLVEKYCKEASHICQSLNLGRQVRNDIEEIMQFLSDRNY